MLNWKPLPGEDAKSYVERVGGWDGANIEMMKVLQSEFGYDQGDAKTLGLTSSTFWLTFLRAKLSKLHDYGHSRRSALRLIERHNDDWGIDKPTLKPSEINELLNQFQNWKE